MVTLGLIAASVGSVYLVVHEYEVDVRGHMEPPRTPPAEQQAAEPVSDTPAPISSYHNAVARASQSVVNIYTTQTMTEHPYMDDPVLRRFFLNIMVAHHKSRVIPI